MAVSRIGGTSGKLSGQVGSTIYQIVNNGNGTFTQIAYAKGERTETVFTPKLQAQRMIVGMVESLMKDLKPLLSVSFQAGRNKTASCNQFSAANIRLVQRDCKDHWYGDNVFVFPIQYKGYPDFSELGGPYMISSGSLSGNLFDELIEDLYAPANWEPLQYSDSAVWGLKFNCRIGIDTIEQFRARHKMTILDEIDWAGFRNWISYDPDPEDPKLYSRHDYIRAQMVSSVPSSTVMTREVISSLFKFVSNVQPKIFFARDNSGFLIGIETDYQGADDMFYYFAGFSISHASGKKLISTSFYHTGSGDTTPYMVGRQPSMVFGSWMGEPQVKPYPSPF